MPAGCDSRPAVITRSPAIPDRVCGEQCASDTQGVAAHRLDAYRTGEAARMFAETR